MADAKAFFEAVKSKIVVESSGSFYEVSNALELAHWLEDEFDLEPEVTDDFALWLRLMNIEAKSDDEALSKVLALISYRLGL